MIILNNDVLSKYKLLLTSRDILAKLRESLFQTNTKCNVSLVIIIKLLLNCNLMLNFELV